MANLWHVCHSITESFKGCTITTDLLGKEDRQLMHQTVLLSKISIKLHFKDSKSSPKGRVEDMTVIEY